MRRYQPLILSACFIIGMGGAAGYFFQVKSFSAPRWDGPKILEREAVRTAEQGLDSGIDAIRYNLHEYKVERRVTPDANGSRTVTLKVSMNGLSTENTFVVWPRRNAGPGLENPSKIIRPPISVLPGEP
jgi:hypothetical protein